jgi:hypothetical protein
MKGRDAGLTFGLGLLLLLGVPIGLAEQPDANDSGKWMLEITRANRAPDYHRMSDHGKEAQTVFCELDWQPGWDRADKSHPQPSGLEFYYRMQGTEVRVRVLLVFDSAESPSSSEEELAVGNYLIHPGESITVSQLSQFGLQPVQVKLVTAKPPEATQPEIVNETSSMVVENVDQDRAAYKLFLRNTSALAVDAIVISVFDGDGRCKMHNKGAYYGHFIPPGATSGIELSFPLAGEDEGVVGADGISCSPMPQGLGESSQGTHSGGARAPKIVIEAIDFEDGGCQGDARKAAMLEAERLGREIERPRITAVVENQLASTQPDGMAKLASVQSQVKALSNNVDPAALNSIMARFPTVPDAAKESIERDIQNGLLMEKATFLGNLRLYLFELSKPLASDPSLQRWWEVTKGRCDFLGARRTFDDSD